MSLLGGRRWRGVAAAVLLCLVAVLLHFLLVPFEATLEVVLSPADLHRMRAAGPVGRWLAERSQEWMDFWREEGGRDGFVPFDNAAVLYLLRPALFRCVPVRADLKTSPPWFGIGRPTELVVRDAPQGGTRTRYCHHAGAPFEKVLQERLYSASRSGRGAESP